MNVLLSSVSRKVSLARTWRKACNGMGSKLFVADMSGDCAGMYEGDGSVRLPALDSSDFRTELQRLCYFYGFGLVIPTRDEEVSAFADWKDEFAREGVRLLAPSRETVDICQDKIRFAGWCVERGFKVAQIYGPMDFQFPMFLRARRGKGSSSAIRVTNEDDFRYHFYRLGQDVIIQEFVRAPEFSIDVYAAPDGTVISAVPRHRAQTVAGESWNTITVKSEALQTEAVKLAQALKLTGHAVMQCFMRDGEILWIEVNPRFGGASALAFEAGCNSAEWLLGAKMPTPLAPYEVGLRMLRYTQDRFVRTA